MFCMYVIQCVYINVYIQAWVIFKSRYEYNQQGLFYYNKIISKHYNKINFGNVESKDQNLSNLSPIFIIGLPRSGSTLIETMISNEKHNVISLGETSIFNTEIINLIKDQIFKENFNSEDELLDIDIKKLKQNDFVLLTWIKGNGGQESNIQIENGKR